MIPEGITLEMIIEAAQKIQEDKGWFSAKDIWYEIEKGKFNYKYHHFDIRYISILLRNCDVIRMGPANHNGHTRYRFLEDK